MIRRTHSIILSAILLVLAALPGSFAQNRKIMVIGPHQDDESLIGAGVIHAAKLRGDTVKVVLTTNGDTNGVSTGYIREANTVNAMALLGVSEQDIIFLGYGDGLLRTLYESPTEATVYTSDAGMTHTYANRGLGAVDYHTYLAGHAADYTRANILSDFKSVLTNFQPDEVYTTSYLDGHEDHASTYLFTVGALIALNRAGMNLHTRVHDSVVWASFDPNNPWPAPGVTPTVPYTEPPSMHSGPYLWTAAEHIPVPVDMQNTELSSNAKYQAIQQYAPNDFLNSFTKKDEFFWVHEFPTNVATTATVTASSEDPVFTAMKAVDGVIASAGAFWDGEWITNYEQTGAWIRLSWPQPVTISRIVLYDRPTDGEQILSGTLSFSDGSTIPVGALPDNGSAFPIAFPQKTVTSVEFNLDNAVGWAPTGLNEIEVYGFDATSTDNHAPQIASGPVATPTDINGSQTATIAVDAYDLDGNALLYQWTSDIGTINGTGANVTFLPPLVSTDTYATITVNISDGHGGTATNTTFVGVHPSPVNVTSLTIVPNAVQGGQTATGTVTLNGPAPSGGVVVALSKDNAVVTIPASVAVPAGATTATFVATTAPVATTAMITITGTFNTSTVTAQLSVTPPSLSGLTLSPTSVIGGNSSSGTVQISGAAPAGGITVALASNNPAVATVPASVTIPAGATSATFVAATTPLASTTTATISATVNTSTMTAQLAVARPSFSRFTLNPSSVIGGNASIATVEISGAAPTGGITVTLASSNPAVATVPASVTIPAGATTTTATVNTVAGSVNTSAFITATYVATLSATLAITLQPVTFSSVTVSPTSVSGGVSSAGTVTLAAAAQTGGVRIALSSNNAAAQVPASVTIAAGATSATFAVTTIPVAANTTVSISGSYGTLTRNATLTVTPAALSALSVSTGSVIGGNPLTGTVTLTGPTVLPAVVAISATNGFAVVPASVTVLAGQSSASFTINTVGVLGIAGVDVIANYAGVKKTAPLNLKPANLSALTLTPTSVKGGTSVTGTLVFDGAVPTNGSITLASSNTGVASVTSPVAGNGTKTITFTITTYAVTTTRTSNISVSYSNTKTNKTLTVTP